MIETDEVSSDCESLLHSESRKSQVDDSSQVRLFNGAIILNPTISKTNFLAFLIFSSFIGLIHLPINLLQSPLLRFKYEFQTEDIVELSSLVNGVHFILKLFTASLFAYLADNCGRRIVATIGVIFLSCSALILPRLPASEIDILYFIIQMFIQLGLLALQSVPLLADYVDYETKGRAAGIVTVITFVATSLSTFFASNVDLKVGLPTDFQIIGVMGLFLGLISLQGLKGGMYHKDQLVDRKAEGANRRITRALLDNGATFRSLEPLLHPDYKPGFLAGIKQANNPWILAGYIIAFLSMQKNVLFSFILSNYVNTVTGSSVNGIQAYRLNNIHMITGIFSAIFFGFYADKYNKFKVIICIITTSMIGFILLLIAPSPFEWMAYVSMVVLGIDAAGFVIFTSQLLSKYPNPKYRASVIATGAVFQTIGTSVSNTIGVFLTQYSAEIPFYMYLGTAFISLLSLAILYRSKYEIISRL